jgi:hypothetical protein
MPGRASLPQQAVDGVALIAGHAEFFAALQDDGAKVEILPMERAHP